MFLKRATLFLAGLRLREKDYCFYSLLDQILLFLTMCNILLQSAKQQRIQAEHYEILMQPLTEIGLYGPTQHYLCGLLKEIYMLANIS